MLHIGHSAPTTKYTVRPACVKLPFVALQSTPKHRNVIKRLHMSNIRHTIRNVRNKDFHKPYQNNCGLTKSFHWPDFDSNNQNRFIHCEGLCGKCGRSSLGFHFEVCGSCMTSAHLHGFVIYNFCKCCEYYVYFKHPFSLE